VLLEIFGVIMRFYHMEESQVMKRVEAHNKLVYSADKKIEAGMMSFWGGSCMLYGVVSVRVLDMEYLDLWVSRECAVDVKALYFIAHAISMSAMEYAHEQEKAMKKLVYLEDQVAAKGMSFGLTVQIQSVKKELTSIFQGMSMLRNRQINLSSSSIWDVLNSANSMLEWRELCLADMKKKLASKPPVETPEPSTSRGVMRWLW
jgi:hypothetical protein